MANVDLVRGMRVVLPWLLPGPLLVLAGCLFQSGETSKPPTTEKPFPGHCYELTDDDLDGSPDWKTTIAYDGQGSRIKKTLNSLPEDGDGGRGDSWSYTYDAKGYVLSETEDTWDDGRADWKRTYTRDEKGRILRNESESYGDSLTRSLTLFAFDASGNKLSEKYDKGMDGSFEDVQVLTYDVRGDTLTHAIGDDRDGDGAMRVDRSATYTYDAKGNRLTFLFNGISELVIYEYHYTFDARGYPVTRESRRSGGGLVKLSHFTYDAMGRMLTEANDEGGDGTVEEKFAWDADGNLTLEARDNDGDGVFEWFYQATYDGAGNRLTVKNSAWGAIPEETRAFFYDCWKSGGSAP